MGSPGITHPIANLFLRHGCMDDLATERGFYSQGTWFICVLGLFVDMLSMGACTTRQWQTSDRPVQELNVSAVKCVYVGGGGGGSSVFTKWHLDSGLSSTGSW